MDPVNDIAKLGKYGSVGIILSLIIVLVFVIYLNYSLTTNHISKSNDANLKLSNAITELSTIMKNTNRLAKNAIQ